MRITSYHLSPVSLKCPLPVTLAHSCLAWTLGLGLGSGNRTEVLSTFWCFLLANTCRHQSYFMDEETEARLPPPRTALALSRKSAFLSFKNSSFLMGGEEKKEEKKQVIYFGPWPPLSTLCDGRAHPTLGNAAVPRNRPGSPAGNLYPAARQRGGTDRLVLNQSCLLLSQRVVGQCVMGCPTFPNCSFSIGMMMLTALK